MLHSTTYQQFQSLAQQSQRVVVSQEIYADMLTPIRVFQTLAANKPQAVLLDSSDHATSQDACIYLGFDPIAEFSAHGNQVSIKTRLGSESFDAKPLLALRDFFQQYRAVSLQPLAKFAGGMIGFMAYDAVRYSENIPDQHARTGIPELHFTFYGTNIVFDKRTGKALITQAVVVDKDPREVFDQAVANNAALIEQMLNTELKQHCPQACENEDPFLKVTPDVNDDDFKQMVEQAKRYIRQGDAFQVVLSRQFQRPFHGNDFDVYRALRVLNPSPYQFYIRAQDRTLVGSSPEKLVSLQQGIIEVNPIAGTRPRGQSLTEDKMLEDDLLADEKEVSEHTMLVDLGRNDLGRVSQPGTVTVAELMKINRFSRVMHICSTIQGQLAEGFDAFDVLQAAFPAGTLSGAPKVRAMEIIDELEKSRRNVYGGAIVSIDNQGQMDSCIAIRMALIQQGIATVRAGAGIVLDSDPQAEADETRHKVTAVLDAIQLAEQGLV